MASLLKQSIVLRLIKLRKGQKAGTDRHIVRTGRYLTCRTLPDNCKGFSCPGDQERRLRSCRRITRAGTC